jgi:hypothetical protein
LNTTEVLEKIRPLAELKVHEVDHDRNTAVVVDGEKLTFKPGGRGHQVTIAPEGVTSLVKFVGLPKSIQESLTPKLFGAVATELLAGKEQYGFLAKRDQAIGFVKQTAYRNYPPDRVVSTIEKAVEGVDFNRVIMYPNQVVDLEVVGAREEAVQRGDLVRAGALVTFSPIGVVAPRVQSFVMRMLCTNGATSMDIMRDFHAGGEGDDVWQFFRRSVKASIRSITPILNRWREMIEQEISPQDRVTILAALLKKSGLPQIQARALQQRALEEPPRNNYDMMQLMTWATSHLDIESVALRRVRHVTEAFAHEETHAQICPVCRRSG